MAKKITIHYYTIATSPDAVCIEDCIERLEKLTIAERTKVINQNELKLEDVFSKGDNWCLRFTKVRQNNWPGVGKSNDRSDDLILDDDSALTENTFVVIDPTNGRLVIQYNQSGVRASGVRSFLSSAVDDIGAYEFFPVLNTDALERHKAQKTYTQIDVTIENATEADIAYFSGSAIGSTVKKSITAGVQQIQLTFKVDARVKHNQLTKGFVEKLRDRLMGRGSDNDRLVVKGRDTLDSRVEAIDLLEDAKIREYPEREVSWTPGRRYDPDQMFSLLIRAMND